MQALALFGCLFSLFGIVGEWSAGNPDAAWWAGTAAIWCFGCWLTIRRASHDNKA